MSYILEALKKAQAERQLGSAPTIHTMPIPTAAPDREQQGRTQLYLAAAGIALVLAVSLLWWRQTPAPVAAPAAPTAAVLIPTPVEPAPVIVVPKSAPAPVAIAAAPSKPVSKPLPPAAAIVPAPPVAAPPVAAPSVAAPAAAPSAPEEYLPLMVQLPEAVQRDLPKVAFGGYMYSKNPADRLLLIDKVLRHEGEEVAPGLILEQLQPRAAVMNYRGTRYRVPY